MALVRIEIRFRCQFSTWLHFVSFLFVSFRFSCRQYQTSPPIVPRPRLVVHTLCNVLMCFLCYKWVNFYDLMLLGASSNSNFDNGLAFFLHWLPQYGSTVWPGEYINLLAYWIIYNILLNFFIATHYLIHFMLLWHWFGSGFGRHTKFIGICHFKTIFLLLHLIENNNWGCVPLSTTYFVLMTWGKKHVLII